MQLENQSQGLPEDMPENTKKALVSQRRSLIQDFVNAWRGVVPVKEFFSKHVADDVEYEDCVIQ